MIINTKIKVKTEFKAVTGNTTYRSPEDSISLA